MAGTFTFWPTLAYTRYYNYVTGTFLHHRHTHSLLVLQWQTQHSSTDILDTVEARRFDSSIYPTFNWLFF